MKYHQPGNTRFEVSNLNFVASSPGWVFHAIDEIKAMEPVGPFVPESFKKQ